MKKSEKLSRKTRKMIAKNLIVLAVLATVAFAGVSSWFTKTQSVTASGVVVQTQVADGLEFYIMPPSDNDQYSAINTRLSGNASYNTANPTATPRRTTWHTSSDGDVLFDTSDQEFKFMEGLFLCETTSDGYTFNIPKLMQYDEVAYVDTSQAFDAATANDEYLSFDLYFRSDTTLNNHVVKLQSDSSITPNTTLSGTYNNASDDPDVKDAAIGAVRMAVYDGANRKVLWIPGPYVYYNGMTDILTTGLNSSQYSNKGAVYYTGNSSTPLALRSGEGTDDHAYYSTPTNRQKVMHTAANTFAGSTLGTDTVVVTLNQNGGDGYYYGHIRVNLWIEGEDAEARLAFVGGKFSMSLNFIMI